MTDFATIGFRADTTGLSKAERGLDSLASKGERTERRLGKSVDNTNSSFNSLRTTIGLAGTALAALGSARLSSQIIKQSDTFKNLSSQIRQVTDNEKELIIVRKQLLALSIDTRSDLTNTVDLYAQLTRSTKDLNVSQQDVFGITKTLNNLFVAGGKPISEVSGAIKQLTQGFAAGALRGDEFNSVAEGAPKIMDALAEKLKMTRGELREFAATGGITAEILVEALKDYEDVAQRLADQTTKTFGQAMENATTNLTDFIGEAKGLNSTVDGLGVGIEELSENLGDIVKGLEAAATVIGVAMIPVMGKYAFTLGETAVAQLLVGTTSTKTVNAMGVVTVATATSTVATNALTAATRLLMGPWGLLITAVGVGAVAFANSKEEAAQLTDTLAGQKKVIDELTESFAKFSKERLGSVTLEAHKRAIEIDQRRLEIQKELIALQGKEKINLGVSGTATITEAGLAYDKLNKELVALSEEAKEVNLTLEASGKVFDDNMPKIGEFTKRNMKAIEVLEGLAAASTESMDAFGEMFVALEMQRQELTLTSDEFEIYALRLDAISNGVAPELVESLVDVAKANQKLRNDLEDTEASEKGLESLTSSVKDYGGAWSKTGSVIIDTFGDMADSLGNYMKQMDELNGREKAIAVQRKKLGKDNIEVIALQQNLEFDRTISELDGMKQVASFGAGLFAEKTAASKAFAAVNQAIAVAEIAMMFQKMTLGTAEAGVHVANETVKQGANALTAITSAFAAPFPINFVAGAAMVGIMASLVGGISGGGSSFDPTESRQESQGTGTLLGSDEKSNSIVNAQARFEDISIDQLHELQGIRASMGDLSSSIEQLAVSFVLGGAGKGQFSGDLTGSQSFDSVGGLAGAALGSLFGSTKKKLVDEGVSFISQTLGSIIDGGIVQAQAFFDIETTKKKLFGLSKKVSTKTEFQSLDGNIQSQMADIFGHISDVVLQSAQSLGFNTVNVLQESFDDSFDETDFDGFGREMRARFTTTFTEVEMSLEEALSTFSVNIGDISLEGLSGDEIQAELEAVFSQQADLIAEFLVPAIADYQQMGEGLFDTLTRVTKEQAIFNDTINNMGFDLSDLSNVMSIDVAQSIITMIGGLEAFSETTGEFFDKFFTDEEKLATLTGSLSDVFSSLNTDMPSTREGFRSLVDGLDLTTESGQEMFAMLMQLVPGMDAYFNAIEDGHTKALEVSMDALNSAITLEKERASIVVKAAKDAYTAEIERIELQRTAILEQQSMAQAALEDSELMLSKSIDLEKDRAAVILQLANETYNEEVSRIKDQRTLLSEQRSLLQENLTFAESMIKKSIDIEKGRVNAVLAAANEAFNIEVERLSKQKELLNEQKALAEKGVADSIEALNASFDAEKNIIKEMSNTKIEEINKQSALEQELINSISNAKVDSLNLEMSLISDKKSSLSSIVSSMESLADKTREAAGISSNDIGAALQSARAGNFTAAQGLSGDLPSSDGFSSAAEFKVAQDTAKGQLAQISDLASGKATAVSRQILALESMSDSLSIQIDAEKTNSDVLIDNSVVLAEKQIEAERINADNQVQALDNQLNTLLGIDTSVLSLSDAINGFNEANQSLIGVGFDGANAKLDAELDIAKEQLAIVTSTSTDQLLALDNQLNTLLGIDTSVLSLVDAIDLLNVSNNELSNLNFEQANNALDAELALAKEQLELDKTAYSEQISNLDAQLNSILGIDTSVLELSESTAIYQDAKLALDALNTDRMLEQLSLQEDAAMALLDLAELAYTDEITRLDLIVENAQIQIDLLNGVVENTLTTAQALIALSVAIENAASTPAPVPVEPISNPAEDEQKELSAATMKSIAKSVASTAKALQRIELGGLDTRAIV